MMIKKITINTSARDWAEIHHFLTLHCGRTQFICEKKTLIVTLVNFHVTKRNSEKKDKFKFKYSGY